MPPGVVVEKVIDDCMTHGDTLTITFKDAGFFASAPSGVFAPDLPIGFFPAGKIIGPFTAPNTDKDVILCFFDFGAHFGLYIEDLKIAASCKKSRTKKRPARKGL